ncbi:methyltransferase [Nonomuraea typhae]|uniref:methyltransferase n=1 Tax=Nonomuraea typhae TaxID=2603600 RepID=UPI001CA5D617|nr:methyltransferase [Nonomuraea typhae]
MSRILIVLTSHGVLGETGRATGFHVPEAARPHRIFVEAGHTVDFASARGGQPPRDGVKPGDFEAARFLAENGEALCNTLRLADLDPADYRAVYLVGGHGTMWDFPVNQALARLLAAVYERGGVVAGVCHGPAGLVGVRLADGTPLVDGKLVSAFTNEEETAVGLIGVVPFALESRLVELGARFTKAAAFAAHAVSDRRLITGQNPASAVRVARLVVQELQEQEAAAPRMSAAQHSALYLLEESVSYVYAATLRAIAQLGVADHLAAGPRTAEELAEATGTDAGYLYRALRLLAGRRVFLEEDGRFSLTPQGDALRSDAPLPVRDAVLMTAGDMHWRSAGGLDATLTDGVPAFEQIYGSAYCDHVKSAEGGEVFQRGMAAFSAAVDQLAVELCDFPETGTVVDVGGGRGGLLAHALTTRPGLRGVLFDEAHVLTGHILGRVGDDSRWELHPGDFFVALPGGGDVYVLKRILHHWSDEDCVAILRNCREAMAPGARVVVIDPIVAPGNGQDPAKTHDLIMAMLMTGRERTEAELVRLFERASLRLEKVTRTGAPVSIVEAVAA